jgi:hypothetical protein
MEKAMALSGATKEEQEITPEKVHGASELNLKLISQLGITGVPKAYPAIIRKLVAIREKDGNRFVSNTEMDSIVNEVIHDITEQKQAKILKREIRKENRP